MTGVPPSYQHPGSPPPRPELPDGVAPPAPPEHALPALGVPVWSPFLVVLAAFVAVLAVQVLAVTVVELGGGDVDAVSESDAATIGFTVVLDLSLVAFTVAVVRWLGGRPSPAAFGLRMPAWAPALGWTLAAYAAFWVVAIVVGIAFGEPEEQDIVGDLKNEDSLLILAGFGVMVCLFAPLAEEFFFRGFLFRVLRERFNIAVGVLATGAAFGLVHLPTGDWRGMIILGLFGMALCGLFLLTSSLLPCIMLHAFHNSITFGFTKELPWWGILLLAIGGVMTTFLIARLAMRTWPARA